MLRLPFPCIAASLLFTSLAIAQANLTADELKRTEAIIAKVFEAAGVPAGKNAPWVIVELGSSGWNTEVRGWLVQEDAESITLLGPSGTVSVVRRPQASEKRPKADVSRPIYVYETQAADAQVAWSIREVDYEAACQGFINEDHSIADLIVNNSKDFSTLEFRLVEGLVYGYWAKRLGKQELSQKLFAEALRSRKTPMGGFPGGKARPLDQSVLDNVVGKMWAGARSDANRGMPRPFLVKVWNIIARLPQKDMAKQARALVDDYENLIEEDRNWKEPKDLALLTEQQKIDYWLYKLRDLDDTMYGDMFFMSNGRRTPRHILNEFLLPQEDHPKPNPAMELKKLGWAAVPTIIAHLDDTRPTRAGSLLRYGDCCQQIFEGITNHTIFANNGWDYPVEAGEEKLCKQKAEKWWADFQHNGEKQTLKNAVAEGTAESVAQADRLVEKYPGEALEAIAQGIHQSSNAEIRSRLIQAACRLEGKQVLKLLKEEVRGQSLQTRVTAAEALALFGEKEGFQTLEREWSHTKWPEDWLGQDRFTADKLIVAIIHSGDLRTTQELTKSFARQPLWIRSRIIAATVSVNALPDLRGRPLGPDVRNAIEDMLAAALDDLDVEQSSRGGPSGKTLNNSTIADLAAESLICFWGQAVASLAWTQPLLFDIYASPGVRETQRLRLKNIWRKKRGLPLITVPDGILRK